METFRYIEGRLPLVISIPHGGTYVPPAIEARLTPAARTVPDTDWHVPELYAFAQELGAHLLIATHSRYVIDLNRGPDNASLYPGQFTTGLCPSTFFDGAPLYESTPPDAAETEQRKATYWQPYHSKLQTVLAEQKAQHGEVILFDAHSIRSRVSTLFDGQLPDLNFGTADGKTMKAPLVEQLINRAANSPYSHVLNGRFKGGYITRRYGAPDSGVQALQLELAQCNYMEEDFPFRYAPAKAEKLQTTLRALLEILAAHTVR